MAIRLQAKQDSNLLGLLINREISIDQADLIKKLLEATDNAEPAELEMLGFELDMTIQFHQEGEHVGHG